MKRLFVMGAVMALVGSLGWAETEATPAHAKEGPCKEILQACQAAGFYKGGHKKGPKKGEYLDCMDPILKGQLAPAGVTVTPDMISGCQAVEAKHRAHKGKKESAMGNAPSPIVTPGAAH